MPALVAAAVVLDGLAARLAARDAGLDALVGQGFAEPVGIVASVGEQPVGSWQSVEQGERAGVVAYLARAQEEAEGPPVRVGDRVELRVEPALRASDEAPRLRPGPPFLDRRLEAVRCALR